MLLGSGDAFASTLTYEDLVNAPPGSVIGLPPTSDINVQTDVVYAYDDSVDQLTITGKTNNLRYGGSGGNLQTAFLEPIYSAIGPSVPGLFAPGDFSLTANVDAQGQFSGGSFQITGGVLGTLNPSATGPLGAINWVPDNPGAPGFAGIFGSAGSSTLLEGTLTGFFFDTNSANGFDDTAFFSYDVSGGILQSFGGGYAQGFGLAGSPGFIALDGFDPDGNNATAIDFTQPFTDVAGNGLDVAVPEPTSMSSVMSLLLCGAIIRRRRRRQI
ncbi:MAG: PEP-CTERM sorting domain-containing protein [Planctomycetota bacterium]